MRQSSRATFTRLGANKTFLFLVVLLIIAILLMGFFFRMVALQAGHDREYIGLTGEQQVLSQRMATFALEAARGKQEAFKVLRSLRQDFERDLRLLRNGNTDTGLPPAPDAVQGEVKALATDWGEFRESVDTIVDGRDAIVEIREFIDVINESIPQLLAQSDEVATILVDKGVGPRQVYIATRQLMLAQRVADNVNKILAGGQGAATAADRFGRDAALLGRVLEGMINGDDNLGVGKVADPEARQKLREVSMQFSTVGQHVGAILEKSPALFEVTDAASEVAAQSDTVLSDAQVLERSFATYSGAQLRSWLPYVFGGAALLILGLLGGQLVQDARRQEQQAREQNERNQQAILRLLDEMGDLAEGDLTVQATVSEDITGAIADSMNYAIDALRSLVTTINETSVQVSSAAQQTQATAMHLAEASDHQAQQITQASTAVNEMAVSIDQVSKNADESANVAKKSLDIASKGADTVRRTIDGMNTIREQIQETSKRIKRLGESSQEIGDIVELINDIADQTNILALNAAIQAAMAGEAGRGFAVVADEVQRLAERSSNATKQIEALVKTIQTDTNEAVISMEQSTSDVVSGARLAEEAGGALGEIESVSKQLAERITDISSAARQQSGAAANISDTMNVIQEITTQTSAGTNETAASIGNLAELANELRNSVAGFRLPSAGGAHDARVGGGASAWSAENEGGSASGDEYTG